MRLAVLQEGVDRTLGLGRDELHALQLQDLCHGCLRHVVSLLLQNCNGALQRIDGLRVILVQHIVVGLLDIPVLGRGLLVPISHRDVLVTNATA